MGHNGDGGGGDHVEGREMDRLMYQSMDGWIYGGMDHGAFYEGDTYQIMGSVVRGGGGGVGGEGKVGGRQRRGRFFRGA